MKIPPILPFPEGGISPDFLCFIDADDLMVPNRIATQVDFMKRHPHVNLVFSDYCNFNENGMLEETHFKTCPRLWGWLSDQKELILENPCVLLSQENIGIAGSFLIRKSTLKLETGFEPSLKSCEDFHFYFRLARHTPVGVINEVGMMRRVHGNNMSGNVVRMRLEGIRSRTMLRDSEPDSEVRRHLDRYIVGCKQDLARYYANEGKFLESLLWNLKALLEGFSWPETGRSFKNIVRTVMMTVGLHQPRRE